MLRLAALQICRAIPAGLAGCRPSSRRAVRTPRPRRVLRQPARIKMSGAAEARLSTAVAAKYAAIDISVRPGAVIRPGCGAGGEMTSTSRLPSRLRRDGRLPTRAPCRSGCMTHGAAWACDVGLQRVPAEGFAGRRAALTSPRASVLPGMPSPRCMSPARAPRGGGNLWPRTARTSRGYDSSHAPALARAVDGRHPAGVRLAGAFAGRSSGRNHAGDVGRRRGHHFAHCV